MAAKYGDEQVFVWRRSYDTPPPALTPDDPRFPGRDRRYAALADADLPRCESLKDTVARVMPFWHEVMAPAIASGTRLLVAAHGNSLRALIMKLEKLTPEQILKRELATGTPLIYRFNADGSIAEIKDLA